MSEFQFDPALIAVIAHLIHENDLHRTNREDTIGVLMRCGAFWAVSDKTKHDKFVVELARAVDAYQMPYTPGLKMETPP